jgi:acyl carrier protein
MNDNIKEKLVEIIGPFVKNKEALNNLNDNTDFLKDLQVSSSRLVDIVLAIEDTFNVQVADEEADRITTFGSALSLIQSKLA